MFKKVILQGRYEFGTRRSYDKVIKMFDHLVKVRYKTALLITEEHFNEEKMMLDLGRMVLQASNKYFKNTLDLLRYLSQFAVSGSMGAWMIDEGVLQEAQIIEPNNDKMVVQAFLRGKELSEQEGKEEEAIKALEEALAKYDGHSQAYERRGYVNFKMGNIEDAIYDFTKSIKLDPRNSHAYLGRACVLFDQEKYKECIEDFDMSTKTAIALQPIYWIARRKKARAHIILEEWEKAAFDLKLFTKRNFSEDQNNQDWKQWAYSQYGLVLLEKGDFEEAVEAFNQALTMNAETSSEFDRAEQLVNRGIAKHKAGGSGFLSDWKEAATLGHDQAKELLTNHN